MGITCSSVIYTSVYHCLKSVRIRNFSGPYFSASGLNTERFSPNTGKQAPEKLRIRALFTQSISQW